MHGNAKNVRDLKIFVDDHLNFLIVCHQPIDVDGVIPRPVCCKLFPFAKPFDVDELDARLRALLRRAAGRASPTIRYGDIEVDPAARTVVQDGQPVEMSPREFSVLLVLLQARGRVLSRQQIEERLYSWQSAIESNAVEVHIHHLRRKLGSGCIQTMRGVGYFMPQEPV